MARKLERTQALLGLLAQREATLQVALQLEGLTLQAQELRVREMLGDLLADQLTQVQLPPPPEPPSQDLVTPEILPLVERELQLPRRPEPLEPEEPEPMPPAEDQLWSQLGGLSSTAPSHPSSAS